MIQPSLNFDSFFGGGPLQTPLTAEECLPPRSRTKDPQSSKRAEAEIKRSGAMRGQRMLCLELIEKHPGSTSKQLAIYGTLDRYQLARRLPELQKMGLARTTQAGNEDLKWWPVNG